MASSDRDARIAEIEGRAINGATAWKQFLRSDVSFLIAELRVALERIEDLENHVNIAEGEAVMHEGRASDMAAQLRASLSREAEAKKDAERLATFASLLEQSARAKMEGMIEVIFAVMPPDGGSIGVSFGLDDQAEGSSALDALRNLLDSSRAVSLSEGGST